MKILNATYPFFLFFKTKNHERQFLSKLKRLILHNTHSLWLGTIFNYEYFIIVKMRNSNVNS